MPSTPASDGSSLPVVQVGGNTVPDDSQFAAWEQATSPLFDSIPLTESQSHACSLTGYLVDQLVFSRTAFDKIRFVRSPRNLSDSSSDCITLQYYATGQIQGSLDNGTPLLMQRDRVSIHDFAHAYSGIGETSDNFGIVIPRHYLTAHDDIYRNAPMFSWSLTSPQGRLLISAWRTLWQQFPKMSQAEAPAIAAGFIGLLNGLLASQWSDQHCDQFEKATLKAMQDYIATHLHQPTLNADQLCQTFHCSRATVYRLFQSLGGVKNFIQNQRLNSCYRYLHRLNPASDLRISDIIGRWGFSNGAHFSRVFKQKFGVTPSEVKKMPSPSAANIAEEFKLNHSDIYLLRHWLQQHG